MGEKEREKEEGEEEMKKKYIISLGAGQQSSALAIMIANKDLRLEKYWGCHCVFADTNGEYPETYEWLEILEKYLFERGMLIFRVQHETPLYEHLFEKKSVPMRKFRICTVRWKIKIIEKFLKDFFKGEKIIQLIGFTFDEKNRSKNLTFDRLAPLIEMGYTRDDCIREIGLVGLPIPIKSGCYFCTFQSKKDWQKLFLIHPDLFGKAIRLENNSSMEIIKNGIVSNVPAYGNKKLCDYGGYCHL